MNRDIFYAIISHEIKVLSRNRVMLGLFTIMAITVLCALWSGKRMLDKQNQTIGEIARNQEEMKDSLITRIKRVEQAGMVYPGFIWDDPTFAYNTARNEGPKFAVKQPHPLQMLNVGQSDLQAFYYKVYINKKQYLTYETEISNSFLQFIGNFDFGFVVVFLFPLLIIIFSYNIYAVEKEQGTWVLLRTSNQPIAKIILIRLAIRYTLFTLAFWVLAIAAMILMMGNSFLASSNWCWLMAFVSVYFLFWFSVSFLVNSFSMPANVNAMVLVFIWLFTCILIPNFIQVALQYFYPVPSRITLSTEERNAINRYFEKDGQELTKDVFNNPRTQIRQASIVTPGMVYGYGVIVYKSQEIKDAAASIAEDKLYGQIEKQQVAIQRLQLISPALMLQENLSALTCTHWHQFNLFSRDVDHFRWLTQRFYYPKMAKESTYRTFSVADAKAIPVFKPKMYNDYSWMKPLYNLSSYLVVTMLMLIEGYRRLVYDTGIKIV